MFFGGGGGFEGFPGGMPGGMGGMRGRQADVDNKTLYKTLGLDTNASENEIKKAYRKMAMKHHPDKGSASSLLVLRSVVAARVLEPSCCLLACLVARVNNGATASSFTDIFGICVVCMCFFFSAGRSVGGDEMKVRTPPPPLFSPPGAFS